MYRGFAKEMPDTDDVVLWYALYRLITNYWFEVDFNGGDNAHDSDVPDGYLVPSGVWLELKVA